MIYIYEVPMIAKFIETKCSRGYNGLQGEDNGSYCLIGTEF